MSETIWVRCAEGRTVPLPDGQQVPPHDAPEGIPVLRDLFINRRLADGDVEIVAPPADAAER